MPACSSLSEKDFCLEFLTVNELGAGVGNSLPAESLSDDAYVLQEKIIVPPHMTGEAGRFSALTAAPDRCNAPLVFIGHPSLPAQYSSVIARGKGETTIKKENGAIKVSAEGMKLLFSEPLFSSPERRAGGFSSAFGRIGEILLACEMPESSVVRTWLFMEDTLRDYELLNSTREHFFNKWFSSADCIIPASTGIQGRVLGSHELSIEFCAFSGDRLLTRRQSSPLQNEPISYGKLFSRAVAVRFPENEIIFISGTAPIDRSGRSVHAGDLDRQMTFTLEALYAILREAGGDFSHIVQASVYLKRSADMGPSLNILERAKFPGEKALFQVDVDICRDDLLCEIEVTALISRQPDKGQNNILHSVIKKKDEAGCLTFS